MMIKTRVQEIGRGLSRIPPFWLIVIAFAILKMLVHLFTAANYGYLCDELYAIDMSKHLAFGYVDMPPIMPALLAANRAVLGDSLFAIHILPAIAGSATLVLVCLIVRELGGRLFATALGAAAFLVIPFYLMMNSIFGYDGFDQLGLIAFLYLLVQLIQTENQRLWIALGLVGGIAGMTKVTILYLAPGLLAALLATKLRKQFLTRWPWAGLGVFLAVVSPYLTWQALNSWPTLEYWLGYKSFQLQDVTIPEFMLNTVLGMNPLLVPLYLAGLGWVFLARDGKRYAGLGILFLITLSFLFVLQAKYFMLAELVVFLLAAGSVFTEQLLDGIRWRSAVQAGAVACLLAAGILAAPSHLPILEPQSMEQYGEVFGFLYKPAKIGPYAATNLPVILENRVGWEDLARAVADVYYDLPEAERATVGIYADWFGPAGAINHYGEQYGLPEAVSGHLTYYLWGPGSDWEEMIIVTLNIDQFRFFFEDIQKKGFYVNEYASPISTNIGIYVARKPKWDIRNIWPMVKMYK